ncbi:hypothetical protein GQF42_00860 [Streptomyces broussonetiae]|uniref:Uncharacterized protein n=1 Tax=Streptomyces broussonetiae TaxID=2686304 RepID=A0A6I6MWX2_9ACTN|nr:hypothetical protein [Streptomyces broussonetiae]QHA02100.1 hypothetical protein GQF42_00860 [Streptomyces broussonetiae]
MLADMQRPAVWLDLGLTIALLPVSVMLVVWLGMHVMFSGDDFGSSGIRTAQAGRRGAWICGCAAVVAGGGLMGLRLWIAGSVNLLVLGAAAVLFAGVAAQNG